MVKVLPAYELLNSLVACVLNEIVPLIWWITLRGLDMPNVVKLGAYETITREVA